MTESLITTTKILLMSIMLASGLSLAGEAGGGAPGTRATRDRIIADSAAADAQADRRIDSLALVTDALSSRIAVENKVLSALKEELPALGKALSLQDEARASVAARSHAAIIRFDGAVASCKEALGQAQSALSLARSDSTGFSMRISQQESGLHDSESALDRSLSGLHRRSDSLAAVQKKLENDSLSAWKTNNDSLNAVCGRLNDLCRGNAGKDSAMRAAVEELNSSVKDSAAAAESYAKESRAKAGDALVLDTLVPSLQGQKTALLRMQEKLQLDSIIQDLTDQLQNFFNKSYDDRTAAGGPDVQKEQNLNVYKGKRDNLLRDEAIVGMMNAAGDMSRQEWIRRVGDNLGVTQKKLDSAIAAQEKNVHDGVVGEKEYQGRLKELATRNRTLRASITRMSRELINAKPRQDKLQRDSASAFGRRESASDGFGKARAAIAAALTSNAAQADNLTLMKDSLISFVAGKGKSFQNELENAHADIMLAVESARRAQAACDSIIGRQQAARNDSISADREKEALVSSARQSMEMKQEDVQAKSSLIEVLAAQLAKAKGDSISAIRDKREQQDVYKEMLREQQRMARREEQPASAGQQQQRTTAPAAPRQTPAEAAQDQLTMIYELIDKGKNAAARKAFGTSMEFLKKNLFPDAFEAVKTTIASLEPAGSKAAHAVSTDRKKEPSAIPAAAAAEPDRPGAVMAPASQPAPPTEPEPEVPEKEASVFISSVPPVASIFMDGQLVGKTNVGYVKVTSGKHMMQFIKAGQSCTMEMSFIEGVNPAQMVKLPCGQ
jgi:hypothetical protein